MNEYGYAPIKLYLQKIGGHNWPLDFTLLTPVLADSPAVATWCGFIALRSLMCITLMK